MSPQYLHIGVSRMGESLAHRSVVIRLVGVTDTIPSDLSDSGMFPVRYSLNQELLNSPNSYVFMGSIVVFPAI